jgi:frataxin
MARSNASKLARIACRSVQTTRVGRTTLPSISATPILLRRAPQLSIPITTRRLFSNSSVRTGITPDDKAPKTPETPPVTKTPADITESEYHTVADEYMDKLLTHLEALQDTREEVDVEFSVSHHLPATCPPPTQHN